MAGLVVLHVSDQPGDVRRALAAAELITTREPMRVHIIVNGSAVAGLTGDPGPIPEAVDVFACERALRGNHLETSDLAGGVGTVPSAVIALAHAQHEGAAYIRV